MLEPNGKEDFVQKLVFSVLEKIWVVHASVSSMEWGTQRAQVVHPSVPSLKFDSFLFLLGANSTLILILIQVCLFVSIYIMNIKWIGQCLDNKYHEPFDDMIYNDFVFMSNTRCKTMMNCICMLNLYRYRFIILLPIFSLQLHFNLFLFSLVT